LVTNFYLTIKPDKLVDVFEKTISDPRSNLGVSTRIIKADCKRSAFFVAEMYDYLYGSRIKSGMTGANEFARFIVS